MQRRATAPVGPDVEMTANLVSVVQAAKALRACPIRFQHPEQAIELTGVGPAVVGLITKRLKKHCDQTGETMPERGKHTIQACSTALD